MDGLGVYVLLRVTFCSVSLALGLAGVQLLRLTMWDIRFDRPCDSVLAAVATGAIFGIIGAPLAVVERLARCWPRSRTHEFAGAGCVAVLTYACAYLSSFNVAYSAVFLRKRDVALAFAAARDCWNLSNANWIFWMSLLAILVALFPALLVARLRTHGLGRQIYISSAGGLAFAFPAVLVGLSSNYESVSWRDVFFYVGSTAGLGAVLALGFWLADRCGQRLSVFVTNAEQVSAAGRRPV